MNTNTQIFPNHSTIYGPVTSWRFGQSLGIDPIFHQSTCSFNCVYCQLGNIQHITSERKNYVSTDILIRDMREFLGKNLPFDVITYSGSGEPTLALNLGEMVKALRTLCPLKPQYILSNATELHLPEVRRDLALMDKVMFKLDAWDEETFQRVNRPAPGITLARILEGIKTFSLEYDNKWELQTMLMPMNKKELDRFLTILQELRPNAIALNTPMRPYPLSWHRENRGNHHGIFDYEVRKLKTIEKLEATEIENLIKSKLECPVYSVYK